MKLVHMEVNRFKYILLGLMGITALCQFGAVIWWTKWWINEWVEDGLQNGASFGYGGTSGKLSFFEMIYNTQILFIAPILLSVGVLAIYVFLIWYRDWFGRDTFIYRLLTLPTARQHIYFAKVTAILLFVFGLVSFQLALLPVEEFIFNLIVPLNLREPSTLLDIIKSTQALTILTPGNFDEFLVSYGLGIMAVLAIFTAILIERSYRRIGILYAVLYLTICSLAVILPIVSLGLNVMDGYLYPNEIFVIELVMCICVVAISVWLGCRLLAKKITV
ncbi:hypothetical protein [Paenibacillus crassostreae]|uniref:hypothetical protein n=1 Tax=Paenibacillus crassostreae TaxID=1763538 RepID=UPI0012FD263C|nr:hypothetical protein [Paenibacillus crassostreae]